MQPLLDHGHYPEIATHDEPLVRRGIEHLDKRGVSKDAYEFQMLLGVPRSELQQEIVKRGQVVRLYVPSRRNGSMPSTTSTAALPQILRWPSW